jgi:hypothetical protein
MTYLLTNPPSTEKESMHNASLCTKIGGAGVNSRSKEDERLAHFHLSVDAVFRVCFVPITPQVRTRDNLKKQSMNARFSQADLSYLCCTNFFG